MRGQPWFNSFRFNLDGTLQLQKSQRFQWLAVPLYALKIAEQDLGKDGLGSPWARTVAARESKRSKDQTNSGSQSPHLLPLDGE